MQEETKLDDELITESKLKYLLQGNLVYLLGSILLGSILVMTGYELIKEIVFAQLTRWMSHYITIGFVSILITILSYFGIKYYRRLWEDFSQQLQAFGDDLTGERDKFAAYIEAAPYGIFVTNAAGEFIEVNQAAVNLTGYSREELQEMSFLDLHPPGWKQRAKEAFAQVKSEGETKQELICLTKQGQKKWFNVKVVRLSASRTLGFIEDITDRKEILQELKLKEKAIQESATAFAFADQQGVITKVNDSLLTMWNYDTKDQVLGKTPLDLHPETEADRVADSLTYIKQGETWQNELTALRPDGSQFAVLVSCTAMKDNAGTVQGMMASFIDITERKQTEADLRKKKNELASNYEELQALNEKLQTTQQHLAATNERLIKQIKSAQRLHNQLLPHEFPEVNGFFMAGLYQPAEKIGGDFYYTVEVENKLIFYLADITGHGLDGAFLNVFLRETIDNYLFYFYNSEEKLSPSAIAKFVAARYREENFPADYFISLVLFVMDKKTQQVKYINFGFQILPLLIRQGQIQKLSSTGLPISTAIDTAKYEFTEGSFALEVGDKLIATTDGLVEEQLAGERYGIDRLKEVLKQNYQLPVDLLLSAIQSDFAEFTEPAVQQDDVSILGVEKKEVIDELEVSIASNYELIEPTKQKFRQFISPYYQEVDQLLIGLQEMLINAIEHGNQEDATRKVKIKVVVAANYIKVEIKDEGRGFNWQTKVNSCLNYSDFSERGRGIAITETAFDQVCYNSVGNKALLYKRREDC